VLGQRADSSTHRADTIRHKFRPTGIRIGTDVISIAKTQYVATFRGWEMNGDVDFYRYFLSVDIGSWSRNFMQKDSTHSTYANSGMYYRVGIDVNFLTKDIEKNMFFIGLRYGHSAFSETYDVALVDTLWSAGATQQQHFSNDNIKAHWLELTSGLRVKIWKVIWMGYTARFKFGLSTNEKGILLPSDVPGYGRTDKNTTWGFNYQIFVRLPLPKKQ